MNKIVSAVTRRVRSTGGSIIRRLHLLPGGMPDGIGDDDELVGTSLSASVILFFADTPSSLYQLRDWYEVLADVDREFGLTIICMDSRSGRAIREESGLETIVVARDATIDDLLSRSDVKACLYVNHTEQNLLMLRAASVIHVALQHGDSDKAVSISNQIKAYDFAFMAGQAAVDRLARNLMLYDAPGRCITVGYPGGSAKAVPPGVSISTGRRVLYAPTWEGGHSSVAYCSLPSHGETMVRSLLDAGYDVIYRPHPLTGVRLAEYREYDQRVRVLLDGVLRSRVSLDTPLESDFAASDILIADVSAVANHWLRTGKPMIVTDLQDSDAEPASTGFLAVVPRLVATEAVNVAPLVARELTDDPTREARHAIADYYFHPGDASENTIEALRHVIDLRDDERKRLYGE